MTDEQVIGYGLKDKPFFKESMPLLETIDQEEPFYAHLISLTHHHPYLIDDEDATIEPAETGDGSVDRYFQTARYLDESLEQFFDDLKERSEEHTSELQSRGHLVCRLLLEKKKLTH